MTNTSPNLRYVVASKYQGYEIEFSVHLAYRNGNSPNLQWHYEHRRQWPNEEGIYEPPDVHEYCTTARVLFLLHHQACPEEMQARGIAKQIADDRTLADAAWAIKNNTYYESK
jgi:hypothetical protein